MSHNRCLKTAVVLFATMIPVMPCIAQNSKAQGPPASGMEIPEVRIARAVADYLVAGRGTIAKQQGLINDAGKGDKGFTPAIYERLMIEALAVKGIDLRRFVVDGTIQAKTAADPVDRALLQIHHAAKQVIAEAQAKINAKGVGYKEFIPAVYGARTADKFYKVSKIRLKQTTKKPRGDYNRPDRFEKKVLKRFASKTWQKGAPYMESVKRGGRQNLRLMRPIYIRQSCLKCHGDPKGELDLTGRPKEGYKLGDLRGAISVTVPIQAVSPAPGK